jgi:hypothetical protein
VASLVIVHPAEGTVISRGNLRSGWHRLQRGCRWECAYSPEHWALGSFALAIVRGPCNASDSLSSSDHCFPQQALVPFAFQRRVGWVIQVPPSEYLPFCTRDTIKRDTAQTRCAMRLSHQGAEVVDDAHQQKMCRPSKPSMFVRFIMCLKVWIIAPLTTCVHAAILHSS